MKIGEREAVRGDAGINQRIELQGSRRLEFTADPRFKGRGQDVRCLGHAHERFAESRLECAGGV